MKRILAQLLPRRARNTLRGLIDWLDLTAVKIASWSGFAAGLYYLFFSNEFRREQRAVLAGRLHYRRSLRNVRKSSALLRRNTHRLEKGLVMRPRRQVFAEEYIGETVDVFARGVGGQELCSNEQKWASDVLRTYFDAVEDTELIGRARRRHAKVEAIGSDVERLYVPFLHGTLPKVSIGFDEFYALCRHRHSVRWFTPQRVSLDVLRKAIEVARLAPSACNRQPFHFYVATEPSKAQRIASCALGTAGFAHNIPAIVAVVGSLDAYPFERDRHLIYIDGALAAMQMMLGLEALGLSTCPINWPDIDSREKAIGQLLGLDMHERPIMLVAVGYADPSGGVPYSQKKSVDELIKVF